MVIAESFTLIDPFTQMKNWYADTVFSDTIQLSQFDYE